LNGEKGEFFGETPTDAIETTALPEKSPVIRVSVLAMAQPAVQIAWEGREAGGEGADRDKRGRMCSPRNEVRRDAVKNGLANVPPSMIVSARKA